MTTLLMILLFLIVYAAIALEHTIQVNKSATALFGAVLLWVLFMMNSVDFVTTHNVEHFGFYLEENPELLDLTLAQQVSHFVVNYLILEHVGEVSEIILFLMGAMTIVELIDQHGGFNFVNSRLSTRSPQKLLWMVSLMTFFLSAVMDNLTTAIVMIMVLRKIIDEKEMRMLFSCIVILASNSGGAFSPIGDVTTIMLWIGGNVTSQAVITSLFLPSLVSTIIPTWILSFRLKKPIWAPEEECHEDESAHRVSHFEKVMIFSIGIGGLMFVPIFRSLTGLPPFIGILGVLSVLWIYTELLYRRKYDMEESIKCRVSKVLKHIDMSTIFFFFGILMAVSALQEAGILKAVAQFLDQSIHDVYLVNVFIGILSSIVDNVPLVAGAMGMYQVLSPEMVATMSDTAYASNFIVDGTFWQLLAYCAGVGGSILIIGSAAGVVVMGLEKIEFGWYLKRFSLIALVGYLSGVVCYYLQAM